MDDENYRIELRKHLVDQMKSSKLQSTTAQHYKDQIMSSQQQKMSEYESGYHSQRKAHRAPTNGGDADRVLYENYLTHHSTGGDSYRGTNESSYIRQLHNKVKSQAAASATPTLPTNGIITHKYPNDLDNSPYMYDTDSNLGRCIGGGGDGGATNSIGCSRGGGCGGPGSEESGKSQKSSITVLTKRSSAHDLRKMVKSQCKLHEVIDETLKHMCSTELEPTSEDTEQRAKEPRQQQHQQGTQVAMSKPMHCRRCSDKVHVARHAQKDVTTEVAKGDFLECRNGDTLTISVDDVVNSKVINPMIRKLQRMYLNNLREEMSLMEDLERLPHKVNEVYKATIFKQKD